MKTYVVFRGHGVNLGTLGDGRMRVGIAFRRLERKYSVVTVPPSLAPLFVPCICAPLHPISSSCDAPVDVLRPHSLSTPISIHRQHSAALHSTAQHSAAQRSTAQHSGSAAGLRLHASILVGASRTNDVDISPARSAWSAPFPSSAPSRPGARRYHRVPRTSPHTWNVQHKSNATVGAVPCLIESVPYRVGALFF